jgi:hypothetical protein
VTGVADERFRRGYAPVFLQCLSERGERGRQAAYELGRRAIGEQLSVLELARIHHGVLLDVLRTHRTPQELEEIAEAASEFLVEALAVFEMTERGFTELLSADRSEGAPTEGGSADVKPHRRDSRRRQAQAGQPRRDLLAAPPTKVSVLPVRHP